MLEKLRSGRLGRLFRGREVDSFARVNIGSETNPLWLVPEHPKDLRLFPVAPNVDWLLGRASELGLKPLCLADVLSQIEEEEIERIVLFDSVPSLGLVGRHCWRIINLDREEETASLQLCGPFGNYDDEVSSVEVSLDRPLFTGISKHNYRIDGSFVDLNEVIQARKEGIKYARSEVILWSDEEGGLRSRENHPYWLRSAEEKAEEEKRESVAFRCEIMMNRLGLPIALMDLESWDKSIIELMKEKAGGDRKALAEIEYLRAEMQKT